MDTMRPDEASSVRVDPERLRSLTREILEVAGLEATPASDAADALIAADLRGTESHGVSNMLRKYVGWLEAGHVNARPKLRILREAPATVAFDSDGGLGIAVAPQIMDEVVTRARTLGIAFATAANGRHLGMLAHTAMLALPHDMIGVSLTAGMPRMVPTFGREARLGTNPLAIAVPTAERPPFVFDSASTVVPVNKVTTATRLGMPLPPGVFVNADGTAVDEDRVPTTEDSLHLAPLGSDPETASHKGYGLASMMEILCSVLAGSPFGVKAGDDVFRHAFAAIDVGAFNDVETFKREMDEFLDMLNATRPAVGRERVLYAGQAEWELEQQRRVDGIPLHLEVAGWFREHCGRHGLDASAFDAS